MDSETRGMIKMAGHAYLAQMDGEFCQCDQPEFCGRTSRICFGCGLVNQQRIKDIDAAMNGPHYFETYLEPDECNLCFCGPADPRHAAIAERQDGVRDEW